MDYFKKYAEWIKPDAKEYIPYDFICMKRQIKQI